MSEGLGTVSVASVSDESTASDGGSQVRLVAIDLDGTLLGEDGQVSIPNRDAVLRAQAAGIVVAIATGRRHSYAMRVLRGLGLPEQMVLISSNGTVTRRFNSDLIERTVLKHETAAWLCGHLAEYRNALVLTFDKVQPDGDDSRGALVVEHLADLHSSIDRWMAVNAPYIEVVVPIEDSFRGREDDEAALIQGMLCGTVHRMRQAEARLLEHPGVTAVGVERSGFDGILALHRTEYPDRDLSIVDILPAGCGKGNAVLQLGRSLGISAAETMAIGDNWNDVSMLTVAGFPVLMKNAPSDLRERAKSSGWALAGHHDRHGVAAVLDGVLAGMKA